MTNYKASEFHTFPFNEEGVESIRETEKGTRWPVLYLIKNDKQIYVGETTNAFQRTKNHLANKERRSLKDITIISNDTFNKSATLDLESNLIEYLNADNEFKLQNKNAGVVGHNYYEREKYSKVLEEIWKQLQKREIAKRDIQDLANTDLFKFSPYKKLTPDQYEVVHDIIDDIASALENNENKTIIVNGGAGTGKTVLAIYLMKLLSDNSKNTLSTLNQEHNMEVLHPNLNILNGLTSRLIVPMTSLRETVGNVFKDIDGLSKNLVIGASQIVPKEPIIKNGKIANEDKEIKIAIVDEAHRLRQKKNMSGFHISTFNKNNELLGLEEGTELDWIVMNTQIQILFYDENQTIKPTDITKKQFKNAINKKPIDHFLESQLRVQAGKDYIKYVNNVIDEKEVKKQSFNNYDVKVFDDVDEMVREIKRLDSELSLCRTVAGFSWKWISQNKTVSEIEVKDLYDIRIGDYKYYWNRVTTDWVNSPGAVDQIGSIHTIQGYDLNYVGVIFGEEIIYNEETNKIEIIKDNYKDENGKKTVDNDKDLLDYIKNIYKVFLTRGIKGTYMCAVDSGLQEYLKKFFND